LKEDLGNSIIVWEVFGRCEYGAIGLYMYHVFL